MSKSKGKNYRIEDRRYQDGNVAFQEVKKAKMKDKRKERRIEHALKTRNIDEFIEVEDGPEVYDDYFGEYNDLNDIYGT